jgi:putative heme iron utilization protein
MIDLGPDNARAVRRLIRLGDQGALATLREGGPYVSLVTYASDHAGCPILLLSGLSDHTKAIKADPRVALLVAMTQGLANPQEGPRASLIGRALPNDDPRRRARFLARHPQAARYADFPDFAFYRLAVERVHFVGGFARAVWLDWDKVALDAPTAAAFAQAEAEGVAKANATLDGDALARAQGWRGKGWRLAGFDADGALLAKGARVGAKAGAKAKVARLLFTAPAAAPQAALDALGTLTIPDPHS